MSRPCVGMYGEPCGLPGPGRRCAEHEAAFRAERTRRANPVYRDPRWRRLSRRAVARHIRTRGYLCPGYGRPPHLARRLTGDHRVPLAAGGAPFDPANVEVLCLSCNGRKGAR